MKIKMNSIFGFLWLLIWIAGAVVAKGFWSMFFTITTAGFYSCYLVIELLFKHYGIL